MNCENCGAPMSLVHDRDYFFCEYCGSFHIPEPPSDGIRVLDQAPEDQRCPVCDLPLKRVAIDRWRGYRCDRCRGVLTDQSSFLEVIEYRRARVNTPPEPPVPIDPVELRRQVGCPLCEKTLDVHPYYGPGNIVIDSCRDCQVIWLDYGELQKVVDAPGRDRRIP